MRFCKGPSRPNAGTLGYGVGVTATHGERPVPHLSEDELLAWRGLLELEARVLGVLDAELRADHDLSIAEFDTLYQLWLQPGGRCRMKDLAEKLLVSRGGVTKLITRLRGRGLVARVSRPGQQAVDAQLTETGEALLAKAMDTHFDGVRRLVTSRLSAAELHTLRTVTTRLREPPA
jgi:DNA-binding MarR family transcriptional regulator